jgi:hypothetical protein
MIDNLSNVLYNLYNSYKVSEVMGTTHNRYEVTSAMLAIYLKLGPIDTFVEVGGYNGSTAPIYGSIMTTNGLIVCIDPQLQIPIDAPKIANTIRPRRFIHVDGYAEEESTYQQVLRILGGAKIQVLMIGVNVGVELQLTIYEKYLPLMDRPSAVMVHDTYDVLKLMDPKIAFDKLRCDNQYMEFVDWHGRGGGRLDRHGESLFILDNTGEL